MEAERPEDGLDAGPRTAATARLALGTAQFGLDYGIANTAGRVPREQARHILDAARAGGITLLDTAYLYGDSESTIGACLRPRGAMKVVTKTPKFTDVSDATRMADRLRAAFYESLSRLDRSTVYGLLVHDANDLLAPSGPAIWSCMEQLQQSGLVEKIGVSIYTQYQVAAVIRRYPLQIMQLPLNAVDGRLARSEVLGRVAARNIEIHARSVFLQGLLLAPLETIASRFGILKDAITRMANDCAAHGLTRIEAALAAVLAHKEVNRVIVGVTTQGELRAILKAAERSSRVATILNLRRWEIYDDDLLNPANWSRLTHP